MVVKKERIKPKDFIQERTRTVKRNNDEFHFVSVPDAIHATNLAKDEMITQFVEELEWLEDVFGSHHYFDRLFDRIKIIKENQGL
jgi:hypothetical protein